MRIFILLLLMPFCATDVSAAQFPDPSTRLHTTAAARQPGAWAGPGQNWSWDGDLTIYHGTLGNEPVAMYLGTINGKTYGRYYRVGDGVEIPLMDDREAIPNTDQRTWDATVWPVYIGWQTAGPQGGRPAIVWIWEEEPGGDHLTGIRRDTHDGRETPFDLRKVGTSGPRGDADERRPDAPSGRNLYYAPLLQTAMLDRGDEHFFDVQGRPADASTGIVAYRMVAEPRTAIVYPRLTRHPDPLVLMRTNAALESEHVEIALAALECVSARRYFMSAAQGGVKPCLPPEPAVSVEYLSRDLLSANLPESGRLADLQVLQIGPFTWDLRRGDAFDFNRLARIYDGDAQLRPFTDAFAAFLQAVPAYRAFIQRAESGGTCRVEDMTLPRLSLAAADGSQSARLVLNVGNIDASEQGRSCNATLAIPLHDLGPLLQSEAGVYFPDLRQ